MIVHADNLRAATVDQLEHLRQMREHAMVREAAGTLQVWPFFGHESDGVMGPWVLSQWARTSFRYNDKLYLTAEHWMMASKARLFKDAVREHAILEAPTPRQAKALGRLVQGFDDQTWNVHRYQIVLAGTQLKFTQNLSAQEYLMSTTGLLVEASPYDRIWGVGLGLGHADLPFPSRWRGMNLLGYALTQFRWQLRQYARKNGRV
jgi:ribA/ribD-fused uncharacterized protein